MRISEFNKQVYRRSYLASEFLRRHRTAIIISAFVFWSAIFVLMILPQEIGKDNNGFLVIGYLWMTVLPAVATYLMPRLVLKIMPIINGYRHDEYEE